ncbi:DUF6591 domain-containing protein [Anaerostipes sp. PC18]|uniref:DUF6591 domain-containing protein n=1 Tax=Anaerostipes sp. PC18 TaxID=3036926 RepID=UPI00308FBC4D|nr:hypothetical protein P8F77_10395 [Anaerostipes sp. PC18]
MLKIEDGRMTKRRRILSVLGITFVMGFSLIACGKNENSTSKENVKTKEVATTEDNKGVKWPEGKFSDMLPDLPKGSEIIRISQNESGLGAGITNMSRNACKDFVDKCKEKGFNKKNELYEDDTHYGIRAEDKSGNRLTIGYDVPEDKNDKEEVSILLFPPEKETSKSDS